MIDFYRYEMLKSTLSQDVQLFDRSENTTRSLTSRLSSQPMQLQELMGLNLSLILIVIIQIIATATLGIATGWKLGLVVVSAVSLPSFSQATHVIDSNSSSITRLEEDL
jgi:ATP-binding cassette subfamily B (MDR/TAP) protein 1